MSDHRKLTHEELNELAGEELPERAAMSLINANVAAPVNAAVALNALSDNSTASRTRRRPPTSTRATDSAAQGRQPPSGCRPRKTLKGPLSRPT